jgi:ankyrin repeat protein
MFSLITRRSLPIIKNYHGQPALSTLNKTVKSLQLKLEDATNILQLIAPTCINTPIDNDHDYEFQQTTHIEGTTHLMKAVEHTRFNSLIRSLINYGAHLDSQNELGQTATMIALNYNKDAVELLVKSGADTDIRNNNRETVLHLLAQEHNSGYTNKHKKMVNLLIKSSKFSINSQDNRGYTPIMHAIYNNNVELVKLLIDGGVKVDVKLALKVAMENPRYIKMDVMDEVGVDNELCEMDEMIQIINNFK